MSKIFHLNKSELHRINHHPILYKYLFILCIGVMKTILLWLLYIISTIVVKPFSVLFIKFKLPLKKLNQILLKSWLSFLEKKDRCLIIHLDYTFNCVWA